MTRRPSVATYTNHDIRCGLCEELVDFDRPYVSFVAPISSGRGGRAFHSSCVQEKAVEFGKCVSTMIRNASRLVSYT